MIKNALKLLAPLAALVIAFACVSSAQAQLFKWVDKDGRTVYSDQPPPADAKKVEQKKFNKNVIESSGDYELQQASKRLPLTLYTTESCAEPCQKAREYLNARGAPFAETVLKSEEQAKPLKARLGGVLEVPVLDVAGTSLQKGFEEGAWNGLLEAAGYPRRTRPGGAPTQTKSAYETGPDATR